MTLSRPVRYRCDLKARLELGSRQTAVRVVELSETGAFVARLDDAEPPELGVAAILTLALPTGDLLPLEGRVARVGTAQREVRSPHVDHLTVAIFGCALSFDMMTESTMERLRDFLELLDGR